MGRSSGRVDFGDPAQVSLVRLAEERYGLTLHRSGREYVCHCPFHRERTPSCYLHPEKNTFHCWGCGKQGGLLDFVAAAEGTDRAGAARSVLGEPSSAVPAPAYAARKAAPARRPAGIVGLQEQRALDTAVEIYHRALVGTGGEAGEPAALDYCLGRGITRRLIEAGSLGYCAGDALLPALAARGIRPYPAWNAGLLAYDRERGDYREKQVGRLTFPIRRESGGWGWLTGRWLGPGRAVAAGDVSRPPPKYLHLPGPKPLLGWGECRGQAMVLLVEGIVCYLLLREWGYPVLCTLGTSPDAEASARLRSFAKTVLVADDDEAGRAMVARLRSTVYADRATVRYQFGDGAKDVGDLAALGRGRERFHACLLRSLRAAA